MTKITLENQYGKYSAEIVKEDMAMDVVLEELIIPVLMAAGFGDETIRKAFSDQDVV